VNQQKIDGRAKKNPAMCTPTWRGLRGTNGRTRVLDVKTDSLENTGKAAGNRESIGSTKWGRKKSSFRAST